LDLIECIIEYTDPYSEAFKEDLNKLKYNRDKEIIAIGNQTLSMTLRSGIKIS
jgi:hypothetical protein